MPSSSLASRSDSFVCHPNMGARRTRVVAVAASQETQTAYQLRKSVGNSEIVKRLNSPEISLQFLSRHPQCSRGATPPVGVSSARIRIWQVLDTLIATLPLRSGGFFGGDAQRGLQGCLPRCVMSASVQKTRSELLACT